VAQGCVSDAHAAWWQTHKPRGACPMPTQHGGKPTSPGGPALPCPALLWELPCPALLGDLPCPAQGLPCALPWVGHPGAEACPAGQGCACSTAVAQAAHVLPAPFNTSQPGRRCATWAVLAADTRHTPSELQLYIVWNVRVDAGGASRASVEARKRGERSWLMSCHGWISYPPYNGE